MILEKVINNSAYSNRAVLYEGSDGRLQWNWRNWKGFLSTCFMALKGIRGYQQFRFTSERPGMVLVRKTAESNEEAINIFKGGDVTVERPPPVAAAGLSRERMGYLAKHVRPYLRDCNKDVTCPVIEE